MKTLETHRLIDGLIFGEGPRWHDGRLWVSDVFGHKVLAIDLNGEAEVIVRMEYPSGLGWLPDGRLLVVAMKDRQIKIFDGERLSTWADLGNVCRGSPNDMVVDSKGRAYVGNTGGNVFAGEPVQSSELVLVEDGKASVVVPYPEMDFPNGTVITPDGKTLIIAETMGHRLTAFDINARDGSLSNRRIFADLKDSTPDGICLDAEGAIWFGSYEKGDFVRVREGGEVTHVKHVEDHWAVACMTGGPDRKTLFMISTQTDHEELLKGNSNSWIDCANLDVPGAGFP
jgi:sugar lactone lactonase YvrE